MNFALGGFQRLARGGFGGLGFGVWRSRACSRLRRARLRRRRAPSRYGCRRRRHRARHGRFPWRGRGGRAHRRAARRWLPPGRRRDRGCAYGWPCWRSSRTDSEVSFSRSRSASASFSFSSAACSSAAAISRRGSGAGLFQGLAFAGKRAQAPRRRPGRVPSRGRCRLRPARSAGGNAAPLRGRGLPRHPAVRAPPPGGDGRRISPLRPGAAAARSAAALLCTVEARAAASVAAATMAAACASSSAALAARAEAWAQRRKCASASALRIWPERLR